MSAYLPNSAIVASAIVAGLAFVLSVGFAITQLRSKQLARTAAWLLVILGVAGIERLTDSQPPGFRMLAIIGMLLYCMKAVVSVESCRSEKTKLRPLSWFCFAGLWFGMQPAMFQGVPGPAQSGLGILIRRGVNRIAWGTLFVVIARLIWTIPNDSINETVRRILATLFLLPGISLLLHFGIFNITAGLWRYFGANCRPLFRAPLLSKSLSEFWGKRWNLAFSEMTAIGIFRPFKNLSGPWPATIISFLFSGLLHELAISVPVKAGFGLPFLYFSLHAMAMLIEKQIEKTAYSIRDKPRLGRLWTLAWLVIPLPLLFHKPFLNGCVWPLIGMETS